ncbi:hypothetical protein C4D60_Mb08t30580 [Musa balbisiana]|uniref:AP2/ERF domain-containing protein n=1 Tax=Musa balbisiana TaxID=52838 RepID=A0A4S8K7M8_MUSBA|nr:hypothetical protein C4D60_Mb08t30580 [Musa balbisiana]
MWDLRSYGARSGWCDSGATVVELRSSPSTRQACQEHPTASPCGLPLSLSPFKYAPILPALFGNHCESIRGRSVGRYGRSEKDMEKSATGKQAQSSSSSPRYKGVRMRKWGSWVAEVRFPNSRERLWLGSYPTAEQAARAYDAAVYCLRGTRAAFNFPDQQPQIPSAEKLSKEEIRAAAMQFAHEEPRRPAGEPQKSGGENSTEAVGHGKGSSVTTAVVGLMMDDSFVAAGALPEWWTEEDEDAWRAAASTDDIYSSSPLWNF